MVEHGGCSGNLRCIFTNWTAIFKEISPPLPTAQQQYQAFRGGQSTSPSIDR